MFKGAVFDMDGLMIDSERVVYNGWQKLMDKHGYDYSVEVFKQTVGRRKNEVEQFYYERYGTDFPYSELAQIQRQNYIDRLISEGIPVKKGLYEILELLKNSGVRIALATSTSRKTTEMNLKVINAERYFDALVCGEDVTNGKPDPEVFLTAAQKIGVPPEKCVAFEDSINGIKSAFAAHMTTVMVPDFVEPTDEIMPLISFLCRDLLQATEFVRRRI